MKKFELVRTVNGFLVDKRPELYSTFQEMETALFKLMHREDGWGFRVVGKGVSYGQHY